MQLLGTFLVFWSFWSCVDEGHAFFRMPPSFYRLPFLRRHHFRPRSFNCDYELCYGRGRFKCADNNGCISSRYLCDGERDCGDGSDETGCPTPTVKLTPKTVTQDKDARQSICGLPLGFQSNAIRDSQLSASSKWDCRHRAANARLHFNASSKRIGAWSAASNTIEEWLQVDFRKVVRINKVATQGRQDAKQWVTSFGLLYSQDGMFWKESPIFTTGNTDQSSVVAQDIKPEIRARYVRILPKTWHGHISMRVEFYGCDADLSTVAPPSCQTSFPWNEDKLSASSQWDSNHKPGNAKLHRKRKGNRRGAWSAQRNDVNQWLMIELDQISRITAVVTQGRADVDQWVKTYSLEYSSHGEIFEEYKENGIVKIFKGNTDRNTLMGHKLSHPIIAQFLRFRPKTWHGHISMRMAVHGCTAESTKA